MTARVLGAVLAGGKSTRFGADKAVALFEGRPLIEHAIRALRPQVESLVVCGRAWPGVALVADRPRPGLGPLGGLSAALRYGRTLEVDLVAVVGCDTPRLPVNLVAALSADAPSIIEDCPLLGCWPVALADTLDAWLASTSDLSLFAWAAAARARRIPLKASLPNVNHPRDLAALAALEANK